eukprot:TRINITY_DN1057_c0_g2_i2.p1 TRINITY_DN1057_c0_g2~~TRINITY_DN1057_c0_g2_i2.p1  ORF type:complete len:114 (+),score=1.04 TRINITY_DN1057_c0_g2_i2:383-724(+)
MEGYLVKRGGVRKNWKKRWFIFRDGNIFYYAKKGEEVDSTPLGCIPTHNLVKCVPISESESMGKENLFLVETSVTKPPPFSLSPFPFLLFFLTDYFSPISLLSSSSSSCFHCF